MKWHVFFLKHIRPRPIGIETSHQSVGLFDRSNASDVYPATIHTARERRRTSYLTLKAKIDDIFGMAKELK